MPITVTPIPKLIDLTEPDFTLGTANAAGSAVTAVASDSTLLAFDTTIPAAVSTSGATGSATVASRRDHVHAESVAEATKTQVEDETSGALYVPPDLVTNSPGVAKGRCAIDNGGALESGSVNVASVTDTGTGDRTIVWDTDFSATTYQVVSTILGNFTGHICNHRTRAVGSVRLLVTTSSDVLADAGSSTVAWGDQ